MSNEIIRLSKKEFDLAKMMNNNVAVEITHRNSEEKTKSGIIIVQDPTMITAHDIKSAEEYDTSQHLDRWGVVTKLPDKLKYAYHNKMFGMDWETEIEIQVGDLVWADYYNLHHCPIFRVYEKDNFDKLRDSYKDYWVVGYDCLIVAKRAIGIDVSEGLENQKYIYESIPLNGYCLFTQINEGLQSKFLELPKEINKKKGIVKYTGSRNKQYNKPKRFDDIDIKEGDEVIFRTESACLLENEQHRFFADEDLRYEQRWSVYGVKTENAPPN